MKILKHVFCCVVISFFSLFLTGCGNKTALNAESFKSNMESKGFEVVDVTSQYSNYSHINSILLARSNDGYQIEFYVLSDTNNAVSVYNNNVSVFENSKSGASSYSTISGNNYSKYTLKSNNYYMLVSRVDNTMIYVKVADNYEDNIKDILNELGY